MTTTPHHEPAALRFEPPAGLLPSNPGVIPAPREPWTPAGVPQFPAVRSWEVEQPFLHFPTVPRRRAPQPGGVLAVRVVGLTVTALCALWPAFFALMFIAFGLGLGDLGAVLMGGMVAVFALGWPLAVWFATTRAQHVWPVLLTLVPTFLTVLFSAYVFLF
ncbi:hypothetical protein [Pseudonocardia sp. WMMC193]|uniref:hypothetical protein n=1 Tax=Pseudonocardia sp. WMMC193 TaxID=2911965 RepID=UPI001F306D8D|nr:hypothetical protein [Pseudonocardia sp. WMMC193]MCF7552834.1 hypothetical protein [Pseudonocardia sp. WMMC193]